MSEMPATSGTEGGAVPLERRSLPDQLRFLARKLSDSTNAEAVALTLQVIADEQGDAAQTAEAAQAKAVEAAVAAERERLRQLARECEATYPYRIDLRGTGESYWVAVPFEDHPALVGEREAEARRAGLLRERS